MKTVTLNFTIITLIFAVVMFAGCSIDPDLDSPKILQEKSLVAIIDGLTDVEVESIMYLVQEEKLAMDVYQVMFELYGLPIFENINLSETKHVDALLRLIEKYDLYNPIEGKAPGEFDDPEFVITYDYLINLGTSSMIESIEAGILVELSSIKHLTDYLSIVESKDLVQVYGRLLGGSERHLASFERK